MEPINKTIRENNNLLFQSAGAIPKLPVLPQELIQTIFAELSSNDIQDAASATKIWNAETIGYIKETADAAIKSTINWIIKQLGSDVHANEIIALKALANESTILESKNLQDVTTATMNTKGRILDILVDVDPVVFQTSNQHPLFNNFILSLSIFKKIKSINEGNLSPEQKDCALFYLPRILAGNGQLNKSLAVVKTISDPIVMCNCILDITKTLSEKKQYSDVILVANATYHLTPSFYNFSNLVFEGIKNAGQEKALRLASKISDPIVQGEVISLINKYYGAIDLIHILAHYGIIK